MTDSPAVEPAVYRVAEVAQLLSMGRRQTYEAIVRGEIQGCHKIGKKSVRCSKVAIHTWLDGKEVNGNERSDASRQGLEVGARA